MSDGNVGATLGVTQTVALFTVLMPNVSDINRHTPDDDHPFTSDVRQAEVMAGGMSLAVGAVMAHIEGSWKPFVVTSVLVMLYLVAYEYTLRKPGHAPNLVTIDRDREATS